MMHLATNTQHVAVGRKKESGLECMRETIEEGDKNGNIDGENQR